MDLFVGIAVILAVALFVWAGLGDLATRRIPNGLCLCVLALGLSLHLMDRTIGPAVLAAGAVFVVCLVAWRFGLFGGGDAKLLSAAALLVPTGRIGDLVLLTTLFGGGLSLVYLLASRLLPPVASRVPSRRVGRIWRVEQRRIRRRNSLPYGVAIAFGSIAVMMSA